MVSMTNTLRRLALFFLLILLLIGFAGHLLAPAGGTQYVQSESTCAFHQGINLPVNIQTSWSESGISPGTTHDDTYVLELILKISHPPTL